jgi:Uma2 family endonuclease
LTAELHGQIPLLSPIRDWTYADLDDLPDEVARRCEIIDGSLHVSPGPTPAHQWIASRLTRLLSDAAPPGYDAVESLHVDFGRDVIEPDVLVLSDRVFTINSTPIVAADVLLAVEIVSPSSRRMDRLVKPAILADGAVAAYWRIEQPGPDLFVVVHELEGKTYREVTTVRAGEDVEVTVPFPVRLRPADWFGPRKKD